MGLEIRSLVNFTPETTLQTSALRRLLVFRPKLARSAKVAPLVTIPFVTIRHKKGASTAPFKG